jgi:hypothetical protein
MLRWDVIYNFIYIYIYIYIHIWSLRFKYQWLLRLWSPWQTCGIISEKPTACSAQKMDISGYFEDLVLICQATQCHLGRLWSYWHVVVIVNSLPSFLSSCRLAIDFVTIVLSTRYHLLSSLFIWHRLIMLLLFILQRENLHRFRNCLLQHNHKSHGHRHVSSQLVCSFQFTNGWKDYVFEIFRWTCCIHYPEGGSSRFL